MSYQHQQNNYFPEDEPQQIYYYQSQNQQQQNRVRFYSNYSENFMSTEASEIDDFSKESSQKSYFQSFQHQSMDGPDSQSEVQQELDCLIQVKWNKKVFQSPEDKKKFVEEYSRKKKTELCKNFMTVGHCKFGNKCSFAHGFEQLKDKQHLHSNYKTKPCRKFFLKGQCQYGLRCQYLHSELLGMPQFKDFVTKVYNMKKLNLIPFDIINDPLKRFARLFAKLKKRNITGMDMIVPGMIRNRLPIFESITKQSQEGAKQDQKQLFMHLNETISQTESLRTNSQQDDSQHMDSQQNFMKTQFQQPFDTIQEELNDSLNPLCETDKMLFQTHDYDSDYEETNLVSDQEDLDDDNQELESQQQSFQASGTKSQLFTSFYNPETEQSPNNWGDQFTPHKSNQIFNHHNQ